MTIFPANEQQGGGGSHQPVEFLDLDGLGLDQSIAAKKVQ